MKTASVILTAAILATAMPSVYAAGLKKLGSFAAWHSYSYKENGEDICFMSATPEKKEISNDKAQRSMPALFITHRGNNKNIVSINLGYTPSGSVTVAIDGRKYDLVSDGETAWTQNDQADSVLASALQKGSTAIITASSARGTKTTDTYNLKYSGDAYKAISKACGS